MPCIEVIESSFLGGSVCQFQLSRKRKATVQSLCLELAELVPTVASVMVYRLTVMR